MKKGLIMTVIAAASLCGCGATSTATSSSSSSEAASPRATATATPKVIDVCQLVTQADAQTLGGTTMLAGQEGNPSNPSCTYNSPPTGPTAQVNVYVGLGAKKTLDIDRDVLHHTFTTVPGIGDECVEESNGIFFRKGNTWVEIVLVRLDDTPDQNRVPLEQLATKVAGEL